MNCYIQLLLIALACNPYPISGWESSEMEMFDLVEEMKMTFYEFMGVENTASLSEIKRAYRKLSLEYHPDRSSDPNAELNFRRLSIIYNILKDEELRKSYDDVLEHGLPSWRTPVFYYRTLRKMSNVELAFIVTTIAITIHFATLWGYAFEQRWTLRDRLESQFKRHKASDKKKILIDVEIAELLKEIRSPCFWDILPFAIVRNVFNFGKAIPAFFSEAFILAKLYVAGLNKAKQERSEELERRKKKLARKLQKTDKPPKKVEPEIDYLNQPSVSFENLTSQNSEVSNEKSSCEFSSKWTAEEEILLIRLTNKYPGGFPNRWQKIADAMNRNLSDVTFKAASIASTLSSRMQVNPDIPAEQIDDISIDDDEDFYISKRKAKRIGKLPPPTERLSDSNNVEEITSDLHSNTEISSDKLLDTRDFVGHISRKKQKKLPFSAVDDGAKTSDTSKPTSGTWSQIEQNQLETAMKTVPKNVPERWLRIAEFVPTKSLTDVMERVKFLADSSKRKV